jgi:hypothetical protein
VLRTPFTANVRSAVHEYGGGSYCVGPNGEGIIYTDFPSHVVYWSKNNNNADEPPIQIYPPPDVTTSPLRFADFSVVVSDNTDPFLVAILEDHTDPAPVKVQNSIVTLSLDGKGTITTLASGHDFYAAPQLHSNTKLLAFVAWDHPNMPWDATTLYVLQLNDQFQPSKGAEPVVVHSGTDVSVQEPRWWNDDTLLFLSNVSGWYNLYSWKKDSKNNVTPLYPKEADFSDAYQGWMLGLSPYAVYQDGRVMACYAPTSDDDEAGSRIVLLHLQGDGTVSSSQEFGRANLPPAGIALLCPTASGSALYFHGGSVTEPPAIWCWEQPSDPSTSSIAKLVLSSMSDFESLKPTLEPFMSTPRKIRYPSEGGVGYAYGYYYPPTNLSDEAKQNGILPPLLVKVKTSFIIDVGNYLFRYL